ncbi:hypothetical protein GCM10023340_05710 [Nocardioides marinquilinus]|uniref:Zinc finger CGNR domain-containing protein n=1 Tax=Nocardioides marinquilinus TaxID=1210400 RepID=A0ABP9P869_9ACTN
MHFDSHLDGVVLAAAALVDVVTPGERRGRPYRPPEGDELTAAIGAALRAGSRRARDPAPAECAALLEVGRAARAVFEAADVGDLHAAAGAANRLLAAYRPTPELSRHDEEPWHLHFHGPADRDPSGWGGGMGVALAMVVGSENAERLGVCAAPACDRVFVDVSRNGTRRFCSEACQNRVKAAAHRARQRDD